MTRNLLLLMLAAVSVAAYFTPAVASATPWHINSTGTFSVNGGTVIWSGASGFTFDCQAVSGSGNYTSTTGGTLTLTMGTCSTGSLGHCTSPGEPTGSFVTTTLAFDNVMLGIGTPGILLTPNAETGVFSHFNCGFITKIEGNGLIGTMTSPSCSQVGTTAKWSFRSTAHGSQQHTKYTGTVYSWKRGAESLAIDMEMTVTYPQTKIATCT